MDIISYKTVLVATFIGILPLMACFLLMHQEKYIRSWGFNFLLKVFLVGIITAIPASLLEILFIESEGVNFLGEIIQGLFSTSERSLLSPDIPLLAGAAMIEEVSKGLGMLFLFLKRKRTSSREGILIGIFVGLFFAMTENGIYFSTMLNNQADSFIQIAILRFVLSTTAHVIYSGIMGWLLYKLFIDSTNKKLIFLFLLPLPFLLHLSFNLLLGTPFGWITILFIFGGVVFLYKIYQKK